MASSDISVKQAVSPTEWDARVNLAAAYRLTALFGWDDLVFTHISARVPGPEHHFLINPYGMMFDEITASSLVKVDLEGRKVSESPYEINPAGFTIHSAVHAARDDALCVMHTHSINGVAVSAQAGGVLPLAQESLGVLGSLGYHDYEGIALNEGEKARLVRDLGAHTNLMRRKHGLVHGGAAAGGIGFHHVFERDLLHFGVGGFLQVFQDGAYLALGFFHLRGGHLVGIAHGMLLLAGALVRRPPRAQAAGCALADCVSGRPPWRDRRP